MQMRRSKARPVLGSTRVLPASSACTARVTPETPAATAAATGAHVRIHVPTRPHMLRSETREGRERQQRKQTRATEKSPKKTTATSSFSVGSATMPCRSTVLPLLFGGLLLLAAADARSRVGLTCSSQSNTVIGCDYFQKLKAASYTACCDLCTTYPQCVAITFHSVGGACFLKDNTGCRWEKKREKSKTRPIKMNGSEERGMERERVEREGESV